MALAPQGTFFQSLLTYQRPLEDVGSVSYEFFYQPGIIETQPAIDRMAWILKPEGVRIHWITDNQWDSSEVSPDNLTDVPANHRGPAALPLKPDAWNPMTVTVKGSEVALRLNDQLVYECQLDANSSRTFGLFHFADQTQVRVRNVTMSGNWPKRLPAVAEQELADQTSIGLDRDLPKLKAVYRHDFAQDGLSSQYLTTADTDQQGKVTSRPDGVFVIRPGGGPWLD